MTRDELTDRVIELFPPLADVKPWEWNETEGGEPVVMIERHATFTGMADGAIDLTTSIPNTPRFGVWRIEPSGPVRPGGPDGRSDRDGGGRAGAQELKRALFGLPAVTRGSSPERLATEPFPSPAGTRTSVTSIRACGGCRRRAS